MSLKSKLTQGWESRCDLIPDHSGSIRFDKRILSRMYQRSKCLKQGACVCGNHPGQGRQDAATLLERLVQRMKAHFWSRDKGTKKSSARLFLEAGYIIIQLQPRDGNAVDAESRFFHVGYTNFKTWRMAWSQLQLRRDVADDECMQPGVLRLEHVRCDQRYARTNNPSDWFILPLEDLSWLLNWQKSYTVTYLVMLEGDELLPADEMKPGFIWAIPLPDVPPEAIWLGRSQEESVRERGRRSQHPRREGNRARAQPASLQMSASSRSTSTSRPTVIRSHGSDCPEVPFPALGTDADALPVAASMNESVTGTGEPQFSDAEVAAAEGADVQPQNDEDEDEGDEDNPDDEDLEAAIAEWLDNQSEENNERPSEDEVRDWEEWIEQAAAEEMQREDLEQNADAGVQDPVRRAAEDVADEDDADAAADPAELEDGDGARPGRVPRPRRPRADDAANEGLLRELGIPFVRRPGVCEQRFTVPGLGELRFNVTENYLRAHCNDPRHGEFCHRRRTCNESAGNSEVLRGQGRPLGLLLAWLARKRDFATREEHMAAGTDSHAQRLQQRQMFCALQGAPDFIAGMERGTRAGEGPEPRTLR